MRSPRFAGARGGGQTFHSLLIVGALVLAGCASAPKGELVIRPTIPRQATHQVVGDALVVSLGGASVLVRWLPEAGVEQFYGEKTGLVFPWPRVEWQESPPVVFLVRVRNHTSEEVQFDPTLVGLVTQDGYRERPFSYEEMYERLQGSEGSSARLATLQATLLSRFLVISPGGQREGLLVFPTLIPQAKHLLLEFSSFFVGGRSVPGLFEFQVLRQQAK